MNQILIASIKYNGRNRVLTVRTFPFSTTIDELKRLVMDIMDKHLVALEVKIVNEKDLSLMLPGIMQGNEQWEWVPKK